MKIVISILLVVMLTTLGCSSDGQRKKGKRSGKNKTVEQLTQELENKVKACNGDMKIYEQKIALIKKDLPKEQTEQILKKGIREMIKTLKCPDQDNKA